MGDEKVFLVNICGYDYEISTRISINDYIKIEQAIHGSKVDYQRVFASLIFDKIKGETKPNINDVYIDSVREIIGFFQWCELCIERNTINTG